MLVGQACGMTPEPLMNWSLLRVDPLCSFDANTLAAFARMVALGYL